MCSSAGFEKERERATERPNFTLSFSEGQPRNLQNKRRGWKYGLAQVMLRASPHYHNGVDEHVPNNSVSPIAKGHAKPIDCKTCCCQSLLIRDCIHKSGNFCWVVESTIACDFHHILHRDPFHVTPETSSVSVLN